MRELHVTRFIHDDHRQRSQAVDAASRAHAVHYRGPARVRVTGKVALISDSGQWRQAGEIIEMAGDDLTAALVIGAVERV